MDSSYGSNLRALVVDDEPSVRLMLERLLTRGGFFVATADSLASAKVIRANGTFDLIVTDKNLPDGSGLVLAESFAHLDCEVVVMSACASLDSAVLAIRLGVADYLVKPFGDVDELDERLRRVVAHLRLKRDNQRLIREMTEKNRQLEDLVARDSLTGLFNHAYFQERLQSELVHSQRLGCALSLLFVDLDHFKEINDGIGHQGGDELLKAVARLLQSKSRISDGTFRVGELDGRVAARYGGDEFVLLLPQTGKGGALAAAERLRQWVTDLRVEGHSGAVSVSIGVATYPADGDSRAALIQAADAALYDAKRKGRNQVVAYEGEVRPRDGVTAPVGDVQLHALAGAIEKRAFDFVYQPIVHTDSWCTFGYEALCRPQGQSLAGIIEVLKVAEQSGRMRELGRVLRQLAVQPLTRLPNDSKLFVNLHPDELFDPTLLSLSDELGSSLTKRLVLEISEALTMGEARRSREIITALRRQGLLIALDDLGAGFAGLGALTELDVDFIKLDGALVRSARSGGRARHLLQHLMAYAAGEGVLVIAEGVETQEDWRVVQALECPLVQGFFISAPERGFVPPQGLVRAQA